MIALDPIKTSICYQSTAGPVVLIYAEDLHVNTVVYITTVAFSRENINLFATGKDVFHSYISPR